MAKKCLLLKLPYCTDNIIAIDANVVAGMVAVSVLVVMAVMEMIETGSIHGQKWDFCQGRHSNFQN